MKEVSLIICLRCDVFDFYKKRLDFRLNQKNDKIEIIIVNDGSSLIASIEIEEYCKSNNYKYIFLDTKDSQFSLSRARNVGIQHANTEWIGFEDADLVYPSNHYPTLLDILANLHNTPLNFITVPVIYLKENISKNILSAKNIEYYIPKILSALHFEDPKPNLSNNYIESFAPVTSVIFAKKKEILSVGGFDEDFSGWGGEDRDFVFKLLLKNKLIDKPDFFEKTFNQNLNDVSVFEGWRSLYKIIGKYVQNHGLYGYHLYHEKLSWRSDLSKNNIQLAKEKALMYFKSNILPNTFQTNQPVQIILGYNPHLYNNQLIECLENPYFIEENIDLTPQEYIDKINNLNPEIVIIWNPYGTLWRLEVYKALLKVKIKVIVAERGALPNTIYFDENGLCVESTSYSQEKWDRKLTEEENDIVSNYIKNIRFGDTALEKQNSRQGGALTKLKLSTGNKKILFCPLQLSDDTVTTYFSEDSFTYSNYLQQLMSLAEELPKDWVLVYKNHPLSLEKFECKNTICGDNYHINDLLEASTAVSVFNSGVGLIAQAFLKPVFYYGQCFYKIDGVNYKFNDYNNLILLLKNIRPIDSEKVKKFYFYLSQNFYSYAHWESYTKNKNEKSKVTKIKSINYYIIRIPNYIEKKFKNNKFDIKSSILFNEYKFYNYLKTNKQPLKEKPINENNKVLNLILDTEFLRSRRKLRKLVRNPNLFFKESKYNFLRPIAKIIK